MKKIKSLLLALLLVPVLSFGQDEVKHRYEEDPQGNGNMAWVKIYYKVVNGQEVVITKENLYEKPSDYISNIAEAKAVIKKKIDARTEELILNGFSFGGQVFSLSFTAQINWSNIPNLPESLFPLPMLDKDGNNYSLSYSNRMNFYLTAVGTNNSLIQSGNALYNQVNELESIEEILNFVDPR